MTRDTDNIKRLLRLLPDEDQKDILTFLRGLHPIHRLEAEWNIQAEVILEAISQSTDLIQRGVRGVLADRLFHSFVIPSLIRNGWRNLPIDGDRPFDACLSDRIGTVTIQIKLQRRLRGVPMFARSRMFPNAGSYWNVEVQKTRKGHDATGNLTRPYRYGDFDILAVNLHPSTGNWSRFRYTVAKWLIPDPNQAGIIYKYQPVPFEPNFDWTDDFETCVKWLRRGEARVISSSPPA